MIPTLSAGTVEDEEGGMGLHSFWFSAADKTEGPAYFFGFSHGDPGMEP